MKKRTDARRRVLFIVLIFAVSVCVAGPGCAALTKGSGGGDDAGARRDDSRGNDGRGEFDFTSYFEYTPLSISYDAPQYALPLKSSSIVNYQDAASALGLSPEASALLLKNGFVVTDFSAAPECDDVAQAYKALASLGTPILITSGSLLHTYHVLFDNTLSSIEARDLYDAVWTLSLQLFEACWDTYRKSSGDLKEAALRDAVFLAVGLSLLRPQENQIPQPSEGGPRIGGGPKIGGGPRIGGPGRPNEEQYREFTSSDLTKYTFEVPAELSRAVDAEIDLITEHGGFTPSPLLKYAEDYSQYVPRGHYTTSEKLKNYFKAMMWFGRMSMLIKGSAAVQPGQTCATCDALISEYDARIQTLGACIIASAMDGDRNFMDLWDKVYTVTSFFVGFSDDLGPYQYIEAMKQVFGGPLEPKAFADKQGVLKAKLAEYRSARIYGGTGDCALAPPFTPEQADKCLAKTRGLRLMGQRYVPDSYILSKMVAPYVRQFTGSGMPFTAFDVPGVGVARVFPRGLDIMAVLGSDRALAILNDLGDSHYEDFDKAFAEVKQEIDGLKSAEWNQNLYWNWLWVLRALVNQYGAGYPTFMQSDVWKNRLLTQGLASWTELRHDTILYTKQSYTMTLTAVPMRPRVTGYVEPVPEVYNRLLSLTRMMRKGLNAMNLLDEKQAASLASLEDALITLTAISAKELRGEALDENDTRFIGSFADVVGNVLEGLDPKSRKTTLVADVHTDTNSGMALEEACGEIDLMVGIMKIGSGIYMAAGPELTYFEFKQPMSERLTDEAWREMLERTRPNAPGWTEAYRSR